MTTYGNSSSDKTEQLWLDRWITQWTRISYVIIIFLFFEFCGCARRGNILLIHLIANQRSVSWGAGTLHHWTKNEYKSYSAFLFDTQKQNYLNIFSASARTLCLDLSMAHFVPQFVWRLERSIWHTKETVRLELWYQIQVGRKTIEPSQVRNEIINQFQSDKI